MTTVNTQKQAAISTLASTFNMSIQDATFFFQLLTRCFTYILKAADRYGGPNEVWLLNNHYCFGEDYINLYYEELMNQILVEIQDQPQQTQQVIKNLVLNCVQ